MESITGNTGETVFRNNIPATPNQEGSTLQGQQNDTSSTSTSHRRERGDAEGSPVTTESKTSQSTTTGATTTTDTSMSTRSTITFDESATDTLLPFSPSDPVTSSFEASFNSSFPQLLPTGASFTAIRLDNLETEPTLAAGKSEGGTVLNAQGKPVMPGEVNSSSVGEIGVVAFAKDATVLNAIAIGQEAVKVYLGLVANMSAGPEKTKYLDFLKKVNDALIELQQVIHELQISDSKGARDRSHAQLEATLGKINKMVAQQNEMAAKENKQAEKQKTSDTLNQVGKVIAAIMTVVAIALTVWCPVATALLVITLIDLGQDLAGQKTGRAWQVVTKEIAKGTEIAVAGFCKIFNIEISKKDQETFNVVLGMVIYVAMAAVLALASPMGFLLAGSQTFIKTLETSEIIKKAAVLAGANAEDAAKAEMIVTVVITVLVMLVGIVATALMPAATFGPLTALANASAKIVNAVTSAVSAFARVTLQASSAVARFIGQAAGTIVKILINPEFWMAATQLALAGVQYHVTVQMNTLLADLALLRARYDKGIVESDTVIDILKKMVQKLLESLEGLGKDVTNIHNLLQKNRDDLSEVLSNLYG